MTTAASIQTVGTLVAEGAGRLGAAGMADARLESTVLACHTFGLDRAALLANSGTTVESDDVEKFGRAIERRLADEPLAYIVGEREFYGRPFFTDSRALIPRPETELLVEAALEALADTPSDALVVDVGTGSGCVAATLALERQGIRVVGVDLSAEALALAHANLQRHGLDRRVHLVRGDLLEWLGQAPDLVVANPPYIPSEAVSSLPHDVRDYEPALALDGGPRGTAVIRRLLDQVSRLDAGAVLVEIDPRHADEVEALAQHAFLGRAVRIWPDLAGRARLLQVGGSV